MPENQKDMNLSGFYFSLQFSVWEGQIYHSFQICFYLFHIFIKGIKYFYNLFF
jgi:hypothetical protein